MNACNQQERLPITARNVPESERIDILPKHFGWQMLHVESAIFAFMRQLSPDYGGGLWRYVELSNGGMYMAPDGTETYRIQVGTNDYEGTMSAEAAGITACLFALSHLSFAISDPRIAEHFHTLRDFAAEHAEARAIFAAID